MPDDVKMFDPLPENDAAAGPAPQQTMSSKADWQPISPIPDDVVDNFPRHELGPPGEWWTYRDKARRRLLVICRWNNPDGSKAIRPLTYCKDENGRREWRWSSLKVPRPLYGLDRLAERHNAPVLVVEGEKTADAAQKLFPEFVVITWPGGKGNVKSADWKPITGRSIVFWPDADEAGKAAAEEGIKCALEAGAAEVSIVSLPDGLPEKWDLANDAPGDVDLHAMLAAARPVPGSAPLPELNVPNGYEFGPEGLFYRDPNDSESTPCRLAGPFEILAQTRSSEGFAWGLLLRWCDDDGTVHEHSISRAALSGDGREVRSVLMDGGLFITPNRKYRDRLNIFFTSVTTTARARAVDRIGWHDEYFVLPDETIGASSNERIVLQTTSATDSVFQVRGTLGDWRREIAGPAAGNSRLVFAISAAFAAPLLNLVGEESGGFHFRGGSSIGKTTALKVAGSVCGGGGSGIKGYIKQWRTTENGLEGTAVQHCDALLCLDELSQVDPKAAGEAAFMLANGAGKIRAGKDGHARKSAEWRCLFLSTGEIGIADKVAEGRDGRRVTAGQEVRVIDIPADAGVGLGVFESLHDREDGDVFAQHFRRASDECYGTALRQFLSDLVKEKGQIGSTLRQLREAFVEQNCPASADGQIRRAIGRFALVAAAGETAMRFGIVPWDDGEATQAAVTCFLAWLQSRGGLESGEKIQGISQVRKFLELHGDSRFVLWPENGEVDSSIIQNRAGFRRPVGADGFDYYILPEAWTGEVCKGSDARLIASALAERGALKTRKSGKLQYSTKLPGLGRKAVSCYIVTSAVFENGGADTDDGQTNA